jgi:hypothetical protein
MRTQRHDHARARLGIFAAGNKNKMMVAETLNYATTGMQCASSILL